MPAPPWPNTWSTNDPPTQPRLDRTVPVRRLDRLPPPDGRLSPRSINTICEQIGHWHDRNQPAPTATSARYGPTTCDIRSRSPGAQTGNDAYELQRRLGHASQRYIDPLHQPPEDIAAGYIEGL